MAPGGFCTHALTHAQICVEMHTCTYMRSVAYAYSAALMQGVATPNIRTAFCHTSKMLRETGTSQILNTIPPTDAHVFDDILVLELADERRLSDEAFVVLHRHFSLVKVNKELDWDSTIKLLLNSSDCSSRSRSSSSDSSRCRTKFTEATPYPHKEKASKPDHIKFHRHQFTEATTYPHKESKTEEKRHRNPLASGT